MDPLELLKPNGIGDQFTGGHITNIVSVLTGRDPDWLTSNVAQGEAESFKQLFDAFRNLSVLLFHYAGVVDAQDLARGSFKIDEVLGMVADHVISVEQSSMKTDDELPRRAVAVARLRDLWSARLGSDMTGPEVDMYTEAVRGSLTPEMEKEAEAPALLGLIRDRKIIPVDVQLLTTLQGKKEGKNTGTWNLNPREDAQKVNLVSFSRLAAEELVYILALAHPGVSTAGTGRYVKSIADAGQGGVQLTFAARGGALLRLIEAGRHRPWMMSEASED